MEEVQAAPDDAEEARVTQLLTKFFKKNLEFSNNTIM